MKKHTDLDGVKQVASALLFTDIEKTKYSPMVVQHPFTNTGVTAISVEGSFRLLNLLENPEDLNIWRQSMRQQIDNAETPYQIPLKDFRWYAAFHNEGHHPHVHMICYSADPSKGYGIGHDGTGRGRTHWNSTSVQRKNRVGVDMRNFKWTSVSLPRCVSAGYNVSPSTAVMIQSSPCFAKETVQVFTFSSNRQKSSVTEQVSPDTETEAESRSSCSAP